MRSFPCDQCGACCKNVGLSAELDFLNRGDGICKFLDMEKNLCSVYENRPSICRIDQQYKENYIKLYSWDEFIEINLSVCDSLKKL
ncbi:YkgJ family cysteine cluster protein [Thalassolituus oleivorans]|jgi:Fe-S-cluster containining protein|uniref:YkgJ family cysteine cluster protein n=1 Tax=Thalassolituus oleivorans TaxID=187493 RepID=UPI003C704175